MRSDGPPHRSDAGVPSDDTRRSFRTRGWVDTNTRGVAPGWYVGAPSGLGRWGYADDPATARLVCCRPVGAGESAERGVVKTLGPGRSRHGRFLYELMPQRGHAYQPWVQRDPIGDLVLAQPQRGIAYQPGVQPRERG